ncbi:Transposase IS200 like protein [Planctomycetes bacterium MalM25]|nr:Transposase IS200 like protein [Planctomycetes bacterium MalM25]
MLSLHANVYAHPEGAATGPRRELRGLPLPTLVGPGGGPPPFLQVLPVTFEQMQAALAELPRCDCEPDGFFLLTGHTPEGVFWRLNGHMQEYQPEDADGPSMHRIELNGECPVASLDAVLRTIGWPKAQLAFELVREGVTLIEADFREYASQPATEGEPRRPDRGASRVPAPCRGRDDAALGTSALEANASYTPWHITFGTYGTRLHGDRRPTVDLEHNEYGTPYLPRNELRRRRAEDTLTGPPVHLSAEQRRLIERLLPEICHRGGWRIHTAAAQSDHVHVICDVRSEVHGEKVRRLIKRWLSEALNEKWPDPNRLRWWAVQGSNKAIKDESYLQNAIAYVEKQRTASR